MRVNFVTTSSAYSCARPSARPYSPWKKYWVDRLRGVGTGNPSHAARFCLGKTLKSSPRGNEVFPVKILNFVCLTYNNNKKTLKNIAGFQCHAIQNRSKIKIKTIRQIKSRIWEMKWGKYTKTLAKIWVEGIIRTRDIRGNGLPKFREICMQTPCWSSSGWAPTWPTETNRNICYRVLPQKREFTPRGTHKH